MCGAEAPEGAQEAGGHFGHAHGGDVWGVPGAAADVWSALHYRAHGGLNLALIPAESTPEHKAASCSGIGTASLRK